MEARSPDLTLTLTPTLTLTLWRPEVPTEVAEDLAALACSQGYRVRDNAVRAMLACLTSDKLSRELAAVPLVLAGGWHTVLYAWRCTGTGVDSSREWEVAEMAERCKEVLKLLWVPALKDAWASAVGGQRRPEVDAGQWTNNFGEGTGHPAGDRTMCGVMHASASE